LPLDALFALHPAMPNLHRLYGAQQALIAHAVATPYRDRSHFDGQDILESGHPGPGASETGWLNRALLGLASEGQATAKGRKALGMGAVPPLVVRGKAPVMAWVAERVPPSSPDTATRLAELYHHTDPALASALESSASLMTVAKASGLDTADDSEYRRAQPGIAKFKAYLTEAMTAAAPSVRNQGNRGRIAPTEKARNELTAARPAARRPGVNTQFEPGVGIEGDIGVGGQDAGHRARVLSRQALSLVHAGQLQQLAFGIIGELLPLDLDFPLDHLLLGPDRHQLAGRHRECPGQQARYPGEPDRGRVGRRPGHAEHQRQVGQQTVTGAEHGGACGPALNVAVAAAGRAPDQPAPDG